jgi:hypothetical protein
MNVRVVWWNAQDFAHYDPTRAGEIRWPSSVAEFTAKADLLTAILKDLVTDGPVIIALAETTRVAAETLRDRLLPSYIVSSLDILPRSDFHVALIYPPGGDFRFEPPFSAAYVPRGTRPMAVLDIMWQSHTVRLIAAHWTARFSEASERTRSETARELSRYIFDYLDSARPDEYKHIMLVGDLNEEPHGLLERDLFAQRERARARRKHWSDKDVKRRYLYNISWRMLGEREPASAARFNSAGTYYWGEASEWRTFDHIIVSGSLVTTEYPRIDELATSVVVHDELYRAGAVPAKFWWNGNAATGGASDHLPLTTILSFEAP